ncbi:MAG TPA: diguanylate cyclase, partial [Burkholderiaceae bacterium]|nr:diguanylate cyclase [Burkholderiaceae bacterium]
EARQVAQRCLDSLRLAAIPHGASPLRGGVTLSIGHATRVAQPGEDGGLLVELADAALYAAKRNGRARLVSDGRCA